MEVRLIDYTGMGSVNPARLAAELLAFTKSTRLGFNDSTSADIALMSDEELMHQLDYMAKTIPSSWEFVHYSFLISGVSRAFTHQLVRTRTASFAEQTLRTVSLEGEGKIKVYEGPTVGPDNPPAYLCFSDAVRKITEHYASLIKLGAKVEDARGILPLGTKTNICMSMNLRAFSNFVSSRMSLRVQTEYQEVVKLMVDEVLRVHPWAEKFIFCDSIKCLMELQDALSDAADDLPYSKWISIIKAVDKVRSTLGG